MDGVRLVVVLCINRHLTGDRVVIQLLKRVSHELCTPPLQFTNDRTSLQCSMINLKAGLGHLTIESGSA